MNNKWMESGFMLIQQVAHLAKYQTLKEMEGIYLFESFIRVDSSIEWSQDSSEPVVEFKKSSRSAKEYIALAEEVMDRVSR